MESERQVERASELSSKKDTSNNLSSEAEELTKVFEKNLEALENMVKLIKSDVSKMYDISDPNSSDSEIEIEEATKLKEYLSQPCKPIIDTGSDLTILSEDYAKRLGLKIVPISSEK